MISFLIFIILSAIAGSLTAFYSERKERKYLTSETAAQIIEMSPRKTIDAETGQTNRIQNVLISFRYSIRDEVFVKQKTIGKPEVEAFKINQPAKVCFNPDNPEQLDLFPADQRCGE